MLSKRLFLSIYLPTLPYNVHYTIVCKENKLGCQSWNRSKTNFLFAVSFQHLTIVKTFTIPCYQDKTQEFILPPQQIAEWGSYYPITHLGNNLFNYSPWQQPTKDLTLTMQKQPPFHTHVHTYTHTSYSCLVPVAKWSHDLSQATTAPRGEAEAYPGPLGHGNIVAGSPPWERVEEDTEADGAWFHCHSQAIHDEVFLSAEGK